MTLDTFAGNYQKQLTVVLETWIEKNPRLNAKIDKEVSKFLLRTYRVLPITSVGV